MASSWFNRFSHISATDIGIHMLETKPQVIYFYRTIFNTWIDFYSCSQTTQLHYMNSPNNWLLQTIKISSWYFLQIAFQCYSLGIYARSLVIKIRRARSILAHFEHHSCLSLTVNLIACKKILCVVK